MKKDVASVPRDLGSTYRVKEKKAHPIRKNAIETNDFNQPSGCDTGWPDAPRARNMVLPSTRVSRVGGFDERISTRLHAHKAGPGIVRTAVAET